MSSRWAMMVAGMLMQARRAGRWRRTCDPWSGGLGGSLVTLVALNSPRPLPFSPFKLGSHRSDKIDAQDGARHKYSNKSSRDRDETRSEIYTFEKIEFRSRRMKMRKRSRNIILRRRGSISINCKIDLSEESEKNLIKRIIYQERYIIFYHFSI